MGESKRFLGLHFVFPQRRCPVGGEFHAEDRPATVTKRVAVSFSGGMIQDRFRVTVPRLLL